MSKEKEEVSDTIKTSYRAGDFLPENYLSQEDKKPQWLLNSIMIDNDLEELEQKIIQLRNNLGL